MKQEIELTLRNRYGDKVVTFKGTNSRVLTDKVRSFIKCNCERYALVYVYSSEYAGGVPVGIKYAGRNNIKWYTKGGCMEIGRQLVYRALVEGGAIFRSGGNLYRYTLAGKTKPVDFELFMSVVDEIKQTFAGVEVSEETLEDGTVKYALKERD